MANQTTKHRETQRKLELFNSFVVRMPMLSNERLDRLHDKNDFFSALLELFGNDLIREAILVASPSLFNRLDSLENHESFDEKDKKVLLSFYKYFSRMCSRPTPFGLFSGLCLGRFSERDNFVLPEKGFYKRNLKIEYRILEEFKNRFGAPVLTEKVKLWANSTIYLFQNTLRFTVMHDKKGKKSFVVEAISLTEHLETVYDATKNGATYGEVISIMERDGYGEEDVKEFLLELITLGFLYPEKESSILKNQNGELLQYIKVSGGNKEQITPLMAVNQLIEKINAEPGEFKPKIYSELQNQIKELIPENSLQPFVHVDTVLYPSQNHIDRQRKIHISRAVEVLLKIGKHAKANELSRFKNAFFERYETTPIRLVDALDVDYGVGYPVGLKNSGIEFGDRFKWGIPLGAGTTIDKETGKLKKALENLLWNNKGERGVEIPDELLDTLKSKENRLSPTFYVFAEFLDDAGEMIYVPGIAGGTALRTIGRFSRLDPDLDELIKEVVDFEQDILEEKIAVEFLHNPGGLMGNVVARPDFRKHRISYIDGESANHGNIGIGELYISVLDEELIITKGEKGPKIIPFLSTAHNTENSPNPIYRFLGDFQETYGNITMSFTWDAGERTGFFPRAIYRNIVLSKAYWSFHSEELKNISSWKELKVWAVDKGFDSQVNLVDHDNLLLIDFDKEISYDLLSYHKNKNATIKLEEIIPVNKDVIKTDGSGTFNSEFIFMFKNHGHE